MKRNYLIIVLSLLLVQTGFAQDKLSDLFTKLSGQEDVTHVTITKSMLNMIPDMNSSVNMNGVDVKNILNKLDLIDVFTSKDAAIKKMMAKEATDCLENNKMYETLMVIKDKKDNVVFYGKKDNNLFTSLIMLVNGENECVIIRLLGKFTSQDIQDIAKKVNKK